MPFQPGRTMAAGLLVVACCGVAASSARAVDIALLPAPFGTTELHAADVRSGIALSGYDPVSYFTNAAPLLGTPAIEALWGGVAWRFASAANRAAFLRDPESFAPRIGGYDGLGAGRQRLAGADPLIYAVRSGRLYLFRTEAGRAAFLADPALEQAAEAGWLILRRDLVAG